MMLKPKNNRIIYRFFSWYIRRTIKSDFGHFHFNKVEFDGNKSILLLANHFSWWDGFLMFQLNRLYLKKTFHIMVTEENYRKVWFLKYLGCFSVKKNSRSMVETLTYAGELLNYPQNLVVIFPQGKLHSNYVDEIAFEKGVMKLVNFSNHTFQYIFAAVFVDYFEHRKPTVNCCLKTWKCGEATGLQQIKSAYNKHYETSRQQQAAITV